MVVSENIRIAFRALRANKMRSMLTTLGIIIGVAAVIAVVSIVQGLQFMITKELQGVGATYVMVLPKVEQNQGPGVLARQVKLTWEDGQAIRDRISGIRLITPLIAAPAQLVKYGERQHTVQYLFGVSQDWPEVNNHEVDQGRFFSRVDMVHRRKVAVIGQKVAEELGLTDPVGKEVYVGALPVSIIGVMEKRGQALGQNMDDLVFIPFDTAVNLLGRSAGDQIQLRLQAVDAASVDQVKDGITQLLRQRHKIAEGQPNDFDVMLQDEILKIRRLDPRHDHHGHRRRRRRRPPGRRHRHHEHHAGLRDRAHPRDRRPQSRRRQTPGHPRPVHDRSRHPEPGRRRHRPGRRLGPRRPSLLPPPRRLAPRPRPLLGHPHRRRLQRRGRDLLRDLSGGEGKPARSD